MRMATVAGGNKVGIGDRVHHYDSGLAGTVVDITRYHVDIEFDDGELRSLPRDSVRMVLVVGDPPTRPRPIMLL